MDLFKEFIKGELLVLIPVLYLIGSGIKKSEKIKDKFIPITLGLIGMLLCTVYVLATGDLSNAKDWLMAFFIGATQGILVAGASTYVNQVIKQAQKEE